MCGIIGIFNSEEAGQQVKKALAILNNRGRDGFGISDGKKAFHKKKCNQLGVFKSKNVVGHSLHSVVSHVPQPIKGKGILITNCEIYNWEELNKKYKFDAKNDAELLLNLLDQFGIKKIEELDGVFAFAYWNNDHVVLARDIVGVKPLWFVKDKDQFAFASEKKALLRLGYDFVEELNPRQILIYDLKKKDYSTKQREFFKYLPEHKEKYSEIKKRTEHLLDQAMLKRIPNKKFGLLFSGGIDSTFLAYWLKKKGYNFTCYTAVLESETKAKDLVYAEKIAKQLGLQLKIRKIKIEEIPDYLKKITPLIEDSNVTKNSVALTFDLACQLAKEDGCKVIFSGLGSEEIFAGYERHKNSTNLNQECVSGLLRMYERDLYRDDVITMNNSLELRIPFLDKNLIEYCLKIPSTYKVKEGLSKWVLREISLDLGMEKDFALRKKVAAQYGSKLDYALGKLSKKNGFKTKSEYLKQFYPKPNIRLGVLFSSGKDSTYAAQVMKRQNYELTCLITMVSENEFSYMFHTPAIEMAAFQAEAMDIPLILAKTKGEKEKELDDLEKALIKAKKEYHIEGVVSGAIFSTYQRDRVEKICDKLGLKVFAPLWHKPQEQQMIELVDNDYKIIFTSIAAYGLDKTWLNKVITKVDLAKSEKLRDKLGSNVAGEGGEFESLVLDCPLFKKKLVIEDFEIIEDAENSARMVIKKAKLAKKEK